MRREGVRDADAQCVETSGNAASKRDVGGLRRIKAFMVVLILLVAIPGIEALRIYPVSSATSAGEAGGVAGGERLNAQALVGGIDALASLERIEQFAEADSSEIPEWFVEEVGFLSDARSVRVSENGAVVGYVVEDLPGDVFKRLSEHMREIGWTEVALGGVDGATYVKERGQCTWVLVTCTQVGSDTSVVVRCEVP